MCVCVYTHITHAHNVLCGAVVAFLASSLTVLRSIPAPPVDGNPGHSLHIGDSLEAQTDIIWLNSQEPITQPKIIIIITLIHHVRVCMYKFMYYVYVCMRLCLDADVCVFNLLIFRIIAFSYPFQVCSSHSVLYLNLNTLSAIKLCLYDSFYFLGS